MSFFGTLFHKEKHSESVVLIDIGANSVAGAYARYTEGELPALLYTRRLPIEILGEEPHERAMFRALEVLGSALIREGAPTLARAIGNGRIDSVLVSVDAPWQETNVRTETFERKDPFVFTKHMVTTALEKTRAVIPERHLADESIISATANGYRTRDPYEKNIRHASLTVLTSLIHAKVADRIKKTLRDLYHAERVRLIGGTSLRYQAMRKAFPHEREPDTSSLEQALAAADLGKLWVADNPPKIVSVFPSHIVGSVRQVSTAPPDLLLLLMALYFQHRPPEDKN